MALKLSGAIIDGVIYYNPRRGGLNLENKAVPENYFTAWGWFFPADDVRMITRVWANNRDELRHANLTYLGTVIRSDGSIWDIQMCGESYRIFSEHQKTNVVAVPAERESSCFCNFVEYLSDHPELDSEAHGVWSVERLNSITRKQVGNNHLVPWITLDELMKRLAESPSAEFPPHPKRD